MPRAPMSTRRSRLLLLSTGFSLLTAILAIPPWSRADQEPGNTEHPNIVFILADDLGWTDLACQGSGYYRTPNLDRMASAGVRFTNGYTCGPNCQPTRAALMSGQYAPRTGVYTVGGTDRFDSSMRPLVPVENTTKLDPKIVTIAESLKAAGYATGMFGKWHLGEDSEHHPLAQGFDEAIVSMGKHFDFATTPKVPVPDGIYLADFLTDKAVDFLDRHQKQPFFLYLTHFAVHSPFDAKESLIAKFQNSPPAGGHKNPVYAAMIASVDESVGRVLAKLEELKLADKTLVIFSSDNGGVGGYQTIGLTSEGITDNAPLKAGKGSLYEGGTRVPYLFFWKGTIQSGQVCDAPINSVDLYPTLLELTGAPAPQGQKLDGSSYLARLLGTTPAPQRGPLFWHFPGYLGAGYNQWRTTPVSVMRDGPWKLMEFLEDGHLELYNLAQDIGEKKDLASSEPQRVQDMHQQLQAWRSDIKAPTPATRQNPSPPRIPTEKAKARTKGAGKAKRQQARKAG